MSSSPAPPRSMRSATRRMSASAPATGKAGVPEAVAGRSQKSFWGSMSSSTERDEVAQEAAGTVAVGHMAELLF